MKRKSLLSVLAVILAAAGLSSWVLTHRSLASTADPWAIKADIAESCNCNPACPCVFGSPSTNEHCEGSRLVEIEAGHFGGVGLDGLSVIVTFRMGGWVKYYVSDRASDEQVEAAGQLMSHVFPSFVEWGLLTTEKVPIAIERSDTRLRFATPTSVVEMEVMQGRGGRPVKVHDLPADFLHDYTQFVSVENSHKSATHDFKYSGTNGFTSKIDTKS